MVMGLQIKQLMLLGMILLLVGTAACSSKRKPLVPLSLADPDVKPQAVVLTEQGTQAYQAKQFEDAKKYFEQAVAVVPQSGQAHYNFALALNALGNAEVARQHFLEAANLSPGDQIIWDSPALAPYGDPDTRKRTKDRPYGTERPNFGNMPRHK
ncbi:MAG: tetratricopeptide repeat protein [Nitrospira sp.]|nr:tetratricopeptide repeat protein [Nitrospira sp.]MBH0184316.1 tetratricopeptide repeat protein [Nitrospira sp.]